MYLLKNSFSKILMYTSAYWWTGPTQLELLSVSIKVQKKKKFFCDAIWQLYVTTIWQHCCNGSVGMHG